MWKHIFKLPIYRLVRSIHIKTIKPIITLNKHKIQTFFVLNTANLYNHDIVTNDDDVTIEEIDIDRMRLAEEVKEACLRNDEAISDLMKTLNMCIDEICEQYQHCIAKQIEITLTCMRLDPLSPNWDSLTQYRVEAEELTLELEKYSLLVERIGKMIYTTAFTSLSLGNETGPHILTTEYDHLKNFVLQKYEENQYWHRKLVEINKESILHGGLLK